MQVRERHACTSTHKMMHHDVYHHVLLTRLIKHHAHTSWCTILRVHTLCVHNLACACATLCVHNLASACGINLRVHAASLV